MNQYVKNLFSVPCTLMKQLFSIFFSLYFLVGGFLPKMDFSQLVHIGDAIDHYQCHRSELSAEGRLYGLVDFMIMHFIHPDQHNHDHEHNHDELPLQQFNNGLQFLAVHLIQVSVHDNSSFGREGHIAFVDKFYGYEYFNRIEHPPSISFA